MDFYPFVDGDKTKNSIPGYGTTTWGQTVFQAFIFLSKDQAIKMLCDLFLLVFFIHGIFFPHTFFKEIEKAAVKIRRKIFELLVVDGTQAHTIKQI